MFSKGVTIEKNFVRSKVPELQSLDHYNICLALERLVNGEETMEIRTQISQAQRVLMFSALGMSLGFMLGFLCGFLGGVKGNTFALILGVLFIGVFVTGIVVLFRTSIEMQRLTERFQAMAMESLSSRGIGELRSQYPHLSFSIENINKGGRICTVRIKRGTGQPLQQPLQAQFQSPVYGVQPSPMQPPPYGLNQVQVPLPDFAMQQPMTMRYGEEIQTGLENIPVAVQVDESGAMVETNTTKGAGTQL